MWPQDRTMYWPIQRAINISPGVDIDETENTHNPIGRDVSNNNQELYVPGYFSRQLNPQLQNTSLASDESMQHINPAELDVDFDTDDDMSQFFLSSPAEDTLQLNSGKHNHAEPNLYNFDTLYENAPFNLDLEVADGYRVPDNAKNDRPIASNTVASNTAGIPTEANCSLTSLHVRVVDPSLNRLVGPPSGQGSSQVQIVDGGPTDTRGQIVNFYVDECGGSRYSRMPEEVQDIAVPYLPARPCLFPNNQMLPVTVSHLSSDVFKKDGAWAGNAPEICFEATNSKSSDEDKIKKKHEEKKNKNKLAARRSRARKKINYETVRKEHIALTKKLESLEQEIIALEAKVEAATIYMDGVALANVTIEMEEPREESVDLLALIAEANNDTTTSDHSPWMVGDEDETFDEQSIIKFLSDKSNT